MRPSNDLAAALYVRRDSCYKSMPGVLAFDSDTDARTFSGGVPVVAHPPCRMWGRYAYKAKGDAQERNLGHMAVRQVRENGGVLEHPAASKLWCASALPRPGQPPDLWGGYSIAVNQCDWGHDALKPTWLYIVGCPLEKLPRIPPPCPPIRTVESMGKAQRERTPPAFAEWLIDLAKRCAAK